MIRENFARNVVILNTANHLNQARFQFIIHVGVRHVDWTTKCRICQTLHFRSLHHGTC